VTASAGTPAPADPEVVSVDVDGDLEDDEDVEEEEDDDDDVDVDVDVELDRVAELVFSLGELARPSVLLDGLAFRSEFLWSLRAELLGTASLLSCSDLRLWATDLPDELPGAVDVVDVVDVASAMAFDMLELELMLARVGRLLEGSEEGEVVRVACETACIETVIGSAGIECRVEAVTGDDGDDVGNVDDGDIAAIVVDGELAAALDATGEGVVAQGEDIELGVSAGVLWLAWPGRR